MAKSLADFHTDVLIEVPNCPRPVVNNAILNALVEFCKKSRYWTIDLTPVDIVADTGLYAVTSNVANTNIHEIYHAKANGHDLDPITHDQMNRMWPGFTRKYSGFNSITSEPWQDYKQDQPEGFHQPSQNEILLIGVPAVGGTVADTGGLEISATVYPASTVTNEIPDIIYEEWRETIGRGAKARLMMIPGKDWTNFDAAAVNNELFNRETEQAKGKKARDFARNNKATRRTKSAY